MGPPWRARESVDSPTLHVAAASPGNQCWPGDIAPAWSHVPSHVPEPPAMISVRFTYLTGLKRPIFRNARLAGSWNDWAETPMTEVVAEDGCPAFTATVKFGNARAGEVHRWGVRLDGPAGANAWGINLEVPSADSQ